MRQTYTVNGRVFTLFGRSIRVEGIINFFYFDRPVSEADVQQLAKLIELGRQEKIDELKRVLDI